MKTDKNSETATTSGTPAQSEQTVSDSNQPSKRLKDALLAECRELVRLAEYDPKTGVSTWPHISTGCNDCGRCTNGARFIAQRFGGFVAGYLIENTDPQTLVGADAGGHDFAVVGDFIVDWWGWEYEGSLETPVLTRAEGIAIGKYKPQQAWRIVPLFDLPETGKRPKSVESATKPVRITYERWLHKYRPIKNPLDSNAAFDGCMFETYGADLQFVCAQHPRIVWTLVDCDGKLRICEGLHFVNRFGYFVTEVAAPENRHFSVNAD